jgi:hypothetical protein
MRRLVPLAMMLSALAFFIATPAQAASTASTARPAGTMSTASTAIPQLHHGSNCKTVHSSVKNRTGRICVLMNADDAVGDLLWQDMATFHANSGKLKMVHVNHLFFVVDTTVREAVNFRNKPASGTNAFISTKWYNVTNQMGLAQAQAFRLCIHWADGGVGCWKGQLNSRQVLF